MNKVRPTAVCLLSDSDSVCIYEECPMVRNCYRCIKIDDCYKIKMIQDKDILEFQFKESVDEVCYKCNGFEAY
jgi:hypothetical protein